MPDEPLSPSSPLLATPSDEKGTPSAALLVPPPPGVIRDDMTTLVVNDLLGPAGGPEEELYWREERVRERYLVGMLAPKATPVGANELDSLETTEPDDAEAGASDITAPSNDSMFPSSMGLSFVVESSAQHILVKSEWGRYQRITSETQTRTDGSPALAWKREPISAEPQLLPLKEGNFGPLAPHPDYPEVVFQGRMRLTPAGWGVTLFLVNQQEELTRKKDEAWVFQPKIWVSDPHDRPIFVQRLNLKADLTKMDPITREEMESLNMLYRLHLEFAVGHGVSVHVTLPAERAEKAIKIETEFIPRSEVWQQTPPTVRAPNKMTERV